MRLSAGVDGRLGFYAKQSFVRFGAIRQAAGAVELNEELRLVLKTTLPWQSAMMSDVAAPGVFVMRGLACMSSVN